MNTTERNQLQDELVEVILESMGTKEVLQFAREKMHDSFDNHSFENCHRFTYVGSWFVMDHFRCGSTEPSLWRSERRDRKGNVLKFLYRTDQEMRPLFEKCKDLYECKFYSLSSNADFSFHS